MKNVTPLQCFCVFFWSSFILTELEKSDNHSFKNSF